MLAGHSVRRMTIRRERGCEDAYTVTVFVIKVGAVSGELINPDLVIRIRLNRIGVDSPTVLIQSSCRSIML